MPADPVAAASQDWPEGGLPHGEHPYDYGYSDEVGASDARRVTEWLADLLAGRVETTGVLTGDEFATKIELHVRDIDGGPPPGKYLVTIEEVE